MILHDPKNPASLADEYFIATGTALLVGALVGGATAGTGAVMQHKAATHAGDIQAKAAEDALAFEKDQKAKEDQQYQEERARKWEQEDTDRQIAEQERQRHHAALAPFVEFGSQGIAPLSALLRPSADRPLSADAWKVQPSRNAAAPAASAAPPATGQPSAAPAASTPVAAPPRPSGTSVADLLAAGATQPQPGELPVQPTTETPLPMRAPVVMPNGPPVAPVYTYRSLADLARYGRRPVVATA